MPNFESYLRKIQIAGRRADADATEAQRSSGNARVGRAHLHGFPISVEYGPGAIRRGIGKDGKPWSRVMSGCSYGYIRGTETNDGEQLDAFIGPTPQSQLAFLVEFLTDKQSHDEYKIILGVKNYADAKKIIEDNYPKDFWNERVGEVRGLFMPDVKKLLTRKGIMKPMKIKKAQFMEFDFKLV